MMWSNECGFELKKRSNRVIDARKVVDRTASAPVFGAKSAEGLCGVDVKSWSGVTMTKTLEIPGENALVWSLRAL
jgi:hypothetical protein